MGLTLSEIARLVGGELNGPADRVIEGVAGIHTARPDKISVVEHPRYARFLADSKAGAVMLDPDTPAPDSIATVRVASPDRKFEIVIDALHPPEPRPEGIHGTALIAEDAELGEDVRVGPWVVIESGVKIGARTVIRTGAVIRRGVRVGEDCEIFENVILYPRSEIGDRVILQGAAQVGGDGYGNRMVDGRWEKIRHVGKAVVEDDVEIGPFSIVSRARMDVTRVGKGSRIDAYVYVGHNSDVGEQVAMVGMSGLAGSVTVGDYCMIGAKAGISTHRTLGDGAMIVGGAAVMSDVPAGEKWGGYPAVPFKAFTRMIHNRRKLPALFDRVRQLEKELSDLKAQIAEPDESGE